jgi:peptide/nickel transport system substrate-binding protein
VADPASLGTKTAGAGPYMIDKVVSGSQWTYIPNPNYWDKASVHYKKVIVKFFASGTSGLAALQSGQLNVLKTTEGQVQKASAHLSGVSSAEYAFNITLLADRRPSPTNPLGNVKVRQALNYAVDKAAIVKVLWGDFGHATDQFASRNQPTAYDPSLDNTYPYDPAKAKQLLVEAGYPNGFSLSVLTPGYGSDLTQAEAGYWKKIGVNAKVTTDTSGGFADQANSGKYAAITEGYGGLPMGIQAASVLEPTKSPFNPFVTNDPAVLALIAKAKTAPPSSSVAAWHAVQAYGVHQAWWVAIGSFAQTQIVAKGTYAPSLQGEYFEGFPTYFYPS